MAYMPEHQIRMLVHIHDNLLPRIVNNVGNSLIKAITYLLNCFRFYYFVCHISFRLQS